MLREELIARCKCSERDCENCQYRLIQIIQNNEICTCNFEKIKNDIVNFLTKESVWYEIARVNEAKEILCKCSNCGDLQLHYYNYVPKYCSNCGCKMSSTVIKKEFDAEDE